MPGLGYAHRMSEPAVLPTPDDDDAVDLDEELGPGWTAEIERRVASVDNGTAKMSSWDDVRKRIEASLSKR